MTSRKIVSCNDFQPSPTVPKPILMILKLLKIIVSAFKLSHGTSISSKIICYHCGEKSSPKRTIYVRFNGTIQPVCCNGCAAILTTVAETGLVDQYLTHKIMITPPDDQ